jgi:hypothetical protein
MRASISIAIATEYAKKLITIPHHYGIYPTARVYVFGETSPENRRKDNHPAYLITFGAVGHPYTLYVSAGGEAIMSEYNYRSVIHLRFGTCRKLTK